MPISMQCINIKEKVLGKEYPDFATSLNNLAGYLCILDREPSVSINSAYFSLSITMRNYEK